MQQHQLRFSQTHTKQNGNTLHNDWKNNFSQSICTRLYKQNYNNKHFVHFYPFHFWAWRFLGPLDSCGPQDGGQAVPPLVEPDWNTFVPTENPELTWLVSITARCISLLLDWPTHLLWSAEKGYALLYKDRLSA